MRNRADFDEIDGLITKYTSASNETEKRKLFEKIIYATIPMVRSISRKLARRSTDPIEDIIQVGTIGLIKAVKSFDNTTGTSFKTFVTYFITGEIKHYLRDKASMIKPPREIYELTIRISKLFDELNKNGEIETKDNEIAEKLNVPVSKIREVIEVERRKHVISLDGLLASTDSDGFTLSDKIPDNGYFSKSSYCDNRLIVEEALEKLDKESADILRLNFYGDLSQTDIAKKLGISQMQVSRKIKRALGAMLKLIEEKDDN